LSKTAFVADTPEATALENLVIGEWWWSINNGASMIANVEFLWVNGGDNTCSFNGSADGLDDGGSVGDGNEP
jgi:hypothetical protein